MKLSITSTQKIKPSSPTPHHLRTHKLSFIDQLVPGSYFSIILFYTGPFQNTTKTSNHLKKSLSETLTRFYPYAGQLKEDLYVDCNDRGVTFIEALLACDMSEVIQQPNVNIHEQLLPCKPNECVSARDNLIVQVNYFDCGGMAIAICFHHKIADATTAANFVKIWATLARGASNFKEVICYNSNSVFPARDLTDLRNKYYTRPFLSLDSVTKRFIFDGSKIASLREKIESATRFEVVSAIILGAVIAAYRESDDHEFTSRLVKAFVAVNFRKRMNPPLPEQYFGNNFSMAALHLQMGNKIKYSSLAGELRGSIRKVDGQLVRKLYGDGELLMNIFPRIGAEGSCEDREFMVSSWCNMPFYEADFGWGKPEKVGTGMRLNEAVILVDGCDGEGIEAWVGLSKEDMARFEQDPGIHAYTSKG